MNSDKGATPMNMISITEHKEDPLFSYCHIHTAKCIYNIPLNDILFIESCQKKSLLHTRNESISLPLPLYRMKETLPSSLFLQTHRSFLVNLNSISYIDKQTDPWTIFFFRSEKRAYISRRFRQTFTEAVTD